MQAPCWAGRKSNSNTFVHIFCKDSFFVVSISLKSVILNINSHTKYLFILLTCFTFIGYSQVDSAKIIIESNKNDSVKIKLLEKLINNESDNLLIKLNYCKQLEEYALLKNRKDFLARSYFLYGQTYVNFSKYESAVYYLYKSLPIAEETKLFRLQSKIYNYLGIIYSDQSNSKKAIYFFRKVYALAAQINDEDQQFISSNNLGVDYNMLKQADLAIYYLSISEKIGKNYKKYNHLISIFGNKMESYVILNDAKNCKSQLDSLVYYYSKTAKGIEQQINFNNFNGYYYKFIEDYKKAISYYEANTSIIPKNDLNEIKKNYEGLAQCYSYSNKYEKAFNAQRLFYLYNDSLASANSLQKANELENNYKNLGFEKDLEIKRLRIKRNNILLWSLSSIVLILIASLFFVFRLLKLRRNDLNLLKNKNQIIEEKQIEILASIRYAKRIQDSFLASEKYINNKLKKLMGK